jgi:hypothetical protein
MSEAVNAFATVQQGYNGKLYYISGAGPLGTTTSPTWVECKCLTNVTLSMSHKEADVTTRANGGVEAIRATLTSYVIEADAPWAPSNTYFEVLRAAFHGRTVIGIACMDDDISYIGAQGMWADCQVVKMDREEGADGVIRAKFTIKPTVGAAAPLWKKVAAE